MRHDNVTTDIFTLFVYIYLQGRTNEVKWWHIITTSPLPPLPRLSAPNNEVWATAAQYTPGLLYKLYNSFIRSFMRSFECIVQRSLMLRCSALTVKVAMLAIIPLLVEWEQISKLTTMLSYTCALCVRHPQKLSGGRRWGTPTHWLHHRRSEVNMLTYAKTSIG